jgi:hypothetical protein
MEKFEAKIFRPELIVLANSSELTKLYGLIEKDENFIISWTDEKLREKHSEVIVATHIIGKVKNGEMKLHSIEAFGGK